LHREWGLEVSRSGRTREHICDVCVVGASTVYTSGLSYFTYYVTKELSRRRATCSLLMRRLVPGPLYPAGHRIGASVTAVHTSQLVPTFDGVDWYGLPSVPKALRFLNRQRPRILLVQWWSGSMLPWYLLFAQWARRNGSSVVLELHEDQDPSEADMPIVGPLVRSLFRLLRDRADGFIVHSEWDKVRMARSLALPSGRTFVIPHGPYPLAVAEGAPARQAPGPAQPITLLIFGLIRPYKGIMNLLDAFEALPREDGRGWRLLVVGDTWAGWTEPMERIGSSPYRSEIELVNRFVSDEEIPHFFAQADIVALPYLRSSASGPLQLAMSAGLPIVVSDVGGLGERAAAYTGAVLVPAGDLEALINGILDAVDLVGTTHTEPDSWETIGDMYEQVFESVLEDAGSTPGPLGMRTEKAS
jgi:glycosyltransferase involved in cell wall biosynthesis